MEQQLEIATIPRPRIAFGRSMVVRLVDRAERATGLARNTLFNPCRERTAAYARFAVMRVATECGLSRTRIAAYLGGMNHSSVCHGITRAAEIEAIDEDFENLLALLRLEAMR